MYGQFKSLLLIVKILQQVEFQDFLVYFFTFFFILKIQIPKYVGFDHLPYNLWNICCHKTGML